MLSTRSISASRIKMSVQPALGESPALRTDESGNWWRRSCGSWKRVRLTDAARRHDIQRRNRRTRRTQQVFSAGSASSALIVVASTLEVYLENNGQWQMAQKESVRVPLK